MLDLNKLYLMDCMEGMKEFPDKYFDLAIVDPQYGINITKQNLGEGGGVYRKPKKYKRGSWDESAPDSGYFDLLQRKSKNQIIWGANHFIDNLPFNVSSPCWLVWDKNNGGSDFADCEIAWTSFTSPVRKFTYTWSGFIQGNMKNKETRIHPTQKPIALYKWILHNYAKPDFKIIDTHVGSGSSIIAFLDFGCEWIGFEIDEDYHTAASKRIEIHKAQLKLF